MRAQTVNIINDIADLISVDMTIDAVTALGGNKYRIDTKCTWWLSIGDVVTIFGNDHVIDSFVINESITVLNSPVMVASFPLAVPTYKHGTLRMTQTEVDAVLNKEDLVPFIWLFEVIRDRKNTNEESLIDRDTELRIFFVNTADSSNWLTDDHYTNVIDPMQQMVDLFIDKIKASRFFADDLDYDCLPLINLSQEGQQETSIFDCNLSGIELRLFAQIRVDLSCSNQCKC